MRTAVVLLTRDLRVHDHPALAAAVAAAERVVPLFVFDRALLARFGAPNRVAFLLDSLRDLDDSLRERGGALFVREGEVVEQALRVAHEARAEAIYVSEDVSGYAQGREERLRAACADARVDLHALPGVTAIPPGDLAPDGADCYRVFTPYWRRWHDAQRRSLAPAPRQLAVPDRLARGKAPGGRRSRPRRAVAGAAARRRGGRTRSASRAGSRAASSATTSGTTTSPPTAPRGSARTCISAASRHSSSPSARAAGWAPSRSCASSPGATSTRSCWPRAPRPRTRTSGRAGTAGATMRPDSPPGRRAARATRSSTRGCGSSPARASCTTARACSRPRS